MSDSLEALLNPYDENSYETKIEALISASRLMETPIQQFNDWERLITIADRSLPTVWEQTPKPVVPVVQANDPLVAVTDQVAVEVVPVLGTPLYRI